MFEITHQDREILRRLAGEKAEIATQPIQNEKADIWRGINNRRPARPAVWITEVPWHEFDDQPDLALQCGQPFAQEMEQNFRRELYQWKHFPADMVVSNYMSCPKVWAYSDIGLQVQEKILKQDKRGGIASHQYFPQITEPEDIDKIQTPIVQYDEIATRAYQEVMEKTFGDLMPIRLEGIRHIWFTPWDALYRFIDFENILMDMVMRPEFVDALVARYVDVRMAELDQIEALGLFTAGAANVRVGSGGYGYCDELPENECQTLPDQLWGCGNAQIFATVSPEQHWEFSLKHEIRWLERWGMTYYGCCEPLHDRIDILKRIPNLRKISMSPWADIALARENGAEDYVLSIKPSPALVAGDCWNLEKARKDLGQSLEAARGCTVEIILKDISTVRGDPRRLIEWGQMAMEMVQR